MPDAKLTELALTLRDLHKPGDPLLLANAWDVASAKMTAEIGCRAVATSSAAVAWSFGQPDTDSMPADIAFDAVRRIAQAVEIPVTADLEAGYQLSAEVFIKRLLDAGAVGFNFEDSDHHGGGVLVELEVQTERIAALRRAASAAGVPVVINARIDTFVRHVGDAEAQVTEAIRRGKAYLDAGADCVYPIFAADEKAIGDMIQGIGGALNVLLRPAVPPLETLRKLGVARVSMGGGLFRLALSAAKQAAEGLLAGTLYS